MAVTKNDLQFYLTGLSPYHSVTDTSQSIGGYPCTLYAPTGTLSSDTALATSSIFLSNGYSLLGTEIVHTLSGTSSRATLSTLAQAQVSGSPVSLLSLSLFNNDFGDFKQYRCIAVKNKHATSTFHNLRFYIHHNSLTDDTQIALGVERSSSIYVSGTATGGTIISVIDSALSQADNYFADATIKMLSGSNINQQRVILSFDHATKTLVLDAALPFAVAAGDTFAISPKPSQRLVKGTDTPSLVSFYSATNLANAVSINVNSAGTDLAPNEIAYLWIRRMRVANAPATLNNRIVISAHYGM